MWAWTQATLREAAKTPLVWGLVVAGALAGWFGATLSILAIAEVEAQGRDIVAGTAQLLGVVVALAVCGRTLEDDRAAGFTAAAESTRTGLAGRLAGRWLGATLAAVAASLLASALVCAGIRLTPPALDSLLLASVVVSAHAAAWGLLIGAVGNAPAAIFGGLVLWWLGHLPWGSPQLLAGPAGRAIGAWLPGPVATTEGVRPLAAAATAAVGLVGLTLGLARPTEPPA